MAIIRHLPLGFGIRFLAKRKAFLALSAALIVASIASFLTIGLNFGIDFRGGILLEVRFQQQPDLASLRSRLDGLGLGEVSLQTFGEPNDVLINVQRQEGGEEAQNAAVQAIRGALGNEGVDYRRTEFVGPTVGAELRQAGILATLLSLAAIGCYIWFRFEWHFAVAALAALAHDIIATIGFYSVMQLEFNLATLAAVLTIAGYSINDTVVVFDRVRETLRKYKKRPVQEVLDDAINMTLSRTILTSVTTLLALFALYIFGGEVIQGFVIGLIWGVLIGTYSSIALAVPLLYYLGVRRVETGDSDEPAEAEAA